ncbi:MAG TPA: polysaccharide pyruvyl transferase family protein [Petrimonas sp.]|nr:polysaccharide pyruvyl transferase family protein [Petrimonas sp.]
MKILTITCHNVYNHGASLQEFALLDYLSSIGHDAKTINYQPNYLAESYTYTGVPNKKFKKNFILQILYILAKFPQRFADRKRRKSFHEFHDNYIKATSKKYNNNKELKLDLPVADIYICGSDQIWNTVFENGKDPAFYLDFVPENKTKISYAASFATDMVPKELTAFLKSSLSRLQAISVRESSGVKILNELGLNNVSHVVDPVFLLSRDKWEAKFIAQNEYKPFVFVYDFDNNPLIKKYALYLKEKKGLQIYALSKRIKYADKTFWSIGPDKFLELIYHSSFVLANSFHATAFSCIFEKEFLIFNRNTSINTRMRDFLQEIGLSNRLVDTFDENLVESKITFSEVGKIVNNKIAYSKAFLKESIDNETMVNK